MSFRPLVAAVLVVAGTAAIPAHAVTKVKTVCKIVTDDTGDTFLARATEGQDKNPQEPALDVTSADLASDGKVITAVIRVQKFATPVQSAPEGIGYAFTFLLPTSNLEASLRAVLITGQQPYFEATSRDMTVPNGPSVYLGAATGSVLAAKNEIHISAPVSVFSTLGPIKKGTKLAPGTDEATSGRAVPPSPGVAGKPAATRMAYADAASGKGYTVGTPSCVTPGK